MKTLHFMVTRALLPVFGVAMVFFILILQLVDLFANLWRYINNDVGIREIATVALFYIPKCIAFSLPIASLFSVSFCLGSYQASNELISLFGSGISLRRFTLPILFFGALLCVAGFFFEDQVVIKTYRIKNSLHRKYLNQNPSFNKSQPTVLGENNRLIYYAEYYDDANKTLSELTIIERDDLGNLIRRIDAKSGQWQEDYWVLKEVRLFFWDEGGRNLTESFRSRYEEERFNASPESFQKNIQSVEEMPIKEAKVWLDSLIRTGLAYKEPLTDYYRRYSFALTPFIVVLLSASLGGRFKKNILLMSLLASLSLSVIYYVMQMITAILANHGYISPLAGAWTPFAFFSLGGIILFQFARH